MHQKVDEEREKNRLSSRKGVEKRRKRMGERRRNDNLEKSDLCAQGSSTTRRYHSSPPRRKGRRTPWTLQNPGINHQELLVALHPIRRPTIRRRMSTVSTSENKKRKNSRPPTTKRHPRATLGTHHRRLHYRTTDIARIQCDNGSRRLIHQVRHSHPNHRRNFLDGNRQALPRPCVEAIRHSPKGNQ